MKKSLLLLCVCALMFSCTKEANRRTGDSEYFEWKENGVSRTGDVTTKSITGLEKIHISDGNFGFYFDLDNEVPVNAGTTYDENSSNFELGYKSQPNADTTFRHNEFTITENTSEYIAGTFSANRAKAVINQVADTTVIVNITDGRFKILK